jgi:hypothetical protein
VSLKTKTYGVLVLGLAGVLALAMFGGPRWSWEPGPGKPEKCDKTRAHSVELRWWSDRSGEVETHWSIGSVSGGEVVAGKMNWSVAGSAKCDQNVRFRVWPELVKVRCQMKVDGREVEMREMATRDCNMSYTLK